jgi:xenotropic and polytropic retrovirus receptor 1
LLHYSYCFSESIVGYGMKLKSITLSSLNLIPNITWTIDSIWRYYLRRLGLQKLPSLMTFIGSLLFWLTFKNYWPQKLNAIWYPLIFVCIAVGILLFPFHTLHRSSRQWFAIANVCPPNLRLLIQFRILFSGFYPIEFRDFFLGDQYNSLIYSLANVPLFFCLYAKDWDPTQSLMCTSSHSRLLGFFSTLPPIWRFFQCIRRYADTRRAFPHLVNAGKYSATILMYMTLSLWRIDSFTVYKALFIVFATANTLYCCITLS